MESEHGYAKSQLDLRVSDHGSGQVQIRALGELDACTSPLLREAIKAAYESGVTSVCLDLAEITFADSSALGVLIASAKRAEERHIEFRIDALSERVWQLLEMTRMDQRLVDPSTREHHKLTST